MQRQLLLVLVLVLTTGCATTYIKRVDGVPGADEQPAPTLMGSMIVAVEQDQSMGADDGGSLVDLFQNAGLDTFGIEAQPKLAAEMKKRGFELIKDRDTTSVLDVFAITKDNQAMTTLTGHWVHPEGSNADPDLFNSLFFAEDQRKSIAAKLDALEGAKDKSYFAFTAVKIMHPSGVGCGGLWCWAEPRVRVNFIVLDRAGTKVYDAQGVGNGAGSMFIVDRSPANLHVAVDQAVNALAAAEIETIGY